MNRVLYIVDDNDNKNYKYDILEDTVIYHFSINSSSNVEIHLCQEDVTLYYYYSNINYDSNSFSIKIFHDKNNTHSELFNHGVNVFNKKLDYRVEGVVPKNSSGCICNQENQIINMKNGMSTILPILLIDNYNIDSNHGAYIGKFSEEKMFYMMSRGISREEAYQLLLNGFLINSDSIELSQIDLFLKEIKKI